MYFHSSNIDFFFYFPSFGSKFVLEVVLTSDTNEYPGEYVYLGGTRGYEKNMVTMKLQSFTKYLRLTPVFM